MLINSVVYTRQTNIKAQTDCKVSLLLFLINCSCEYKFKSLTIFIVWIVWI